MSVWVPKEMGEWYSLSSLVNVNSLVNKHSFSSGFDEESSLSFKLKDVRYLDRDSIGVYHFLSLNPNGSDIRTFKVPLMTRGVRPSYGIFDLRFNLDSFDSLNYDAVVLFGGKYLKSSGVKTRSEGVKFNVWSDFFGNEKPLAVPLHPDFLGKINLRVSYDI